MKYLKDLKSTALEKGRGEIKKKAQNPLKIKDFELLLAGSGRRIRIIKAGEIKENLAEKSVDYQYFSEIDRNYR